MVFSIACLLYPHVDETTPLCGEEVIPNHRHLSPVPLHTPRPAAYARYCRLGRKWSVMLTRPRSASAIARSFSCFLSGSSNRSFKSAIRINSNPLCVACSACSMRCTIDLSFGGTYAPTTYQHLTPDVSRKLITLGPNLDVFSSYHPFSAL